jgi:hypothetical protein
MEKIIIYYFEAKGEKKPIIGKFGPVEAMAKANAHFGALPQGAWMAKAGGYYWAKGNFFD